MYEGAHSKKNSINIFLFQMRYQPVTIILCGINQQIKKMGVMLAFRRTHRHVDKATFAEWSKLLGIIPEDIVPLLRDGIDLFKLVGT